MNKLEEKPSENGSGTEKKKTANGNGNNSRATYMTVMTQRRPICSSRQTRNYWNMSERSSRISLATCKPWSSLGDANFCLARWPSRDSNTDWDPHMGEEMRLIRQAWRGTRAKSTMTICNCERPMHWKHARCTEGSMDVWRHWWKAWWTSTPTRHQGHRVHVPKPKYLPHAIHESVNQFYLFNKARMIPPLHIWTTLPTLLRWSCQPEDPLGTTKK